MSGFTHVVAKRRHCGPALALLLLLAADPTQACRCRELSLAEYFDGAERVAEARVVRVIALEDELDTRRYRVEIIRRFKGPVFDEVLSLASSAGCGIGFSPNQRVWLFAEQGSEPRLGATPALWTTTCNGTRPATAGFTGIEAARVGGALAALSDHLDATSVKRDRDSEPRPAIRNLQRDQIDHSDRLALQRQATVAPNDAARAVVIGPPSRLRVLIDRETPEMLEFRPPGRWQPRTLEWLNDKLLAIGGTEPGSGARFWVLDIRNSVIY